LKNFKLDEDDSMLMELLNILFESEIELFFNIPKFAALSVKCYAPGLGQFLKNYGKLILSAFRKKE